MSVCYQLPECSSLTREILICLVLSVQIVKSTSICTIFVEKYSFPNLFRCIILINIA